MILDRFRLDGQVALVTGATRGIGLGIATALAEAGARVILSSRVEKPEVVRALEDAGHRVDYLQADVSDPQQVQKLVADATAITGRLDILVNNAGVAQHGDDPRVHRRELPQDHGHQPRLGLLRLPGGARADAARRRPG